MLLFFVFVFLNAVLFTTAGKFGTQRFWPTFRKKKKKSLSNFQIHKSTLLITGSGSRKKTFFFHTVPSGCRISPRHQISTRSHAFLKPRFPTSLIHILVTSSPISPPHATLHLQKKNKKQPPRALQKTNKQKHSQIQNC